jgi:hypothetical protein
LVSGNQKFSLDFHRNNRLEVLGSQVTGHKLPESANRVHSDAGVLGADGDLGVSSGLRRLGWAWRRGWTSGRIKLHLRKIQAFELITKGLYLRLESRRLLLELYAHIIPVGIRQIQHCRATNNQT